MAPCVTSVDVTEFVFPCENVTADRNRHGFPFKYSPGDTLERHFYAIRIRTDTGVTGQYVGRTGIGDHGEYLLGKDPLRREQHWTDDPDIRDEWGPVDIALWDLAGKYYEAPVHELLGSHRTRLPTYASAPRGDENGGLDSPEAFADFAETCKEMGYPAFKWHTWSNGSGDASNYESGAIEREIDTVHAVGERVGDDIDLMLDPAGELETLSDAIRVGRACDKQDFLWYEDPYRGGVESRVGGKKIRDAIETPLVMTEKVRGLQSKTDFAAAEATDHLRVSHLEVDGGISGAIKAARIAEGFGIDIELNAPGPAQRHCMATIRNSNYYELGLVHPDCDNIHYPPIYTNEYSDRIDAISNDGTVPVPDGNGLGVSYDWDLIDEWAVDRTIHE